MSTTHTQSPEYRVVATVESASEQYGFAVVESPIDRTPAKGQKIFLPTYVSRRLYNDDSGHWEQGDIVVLLVTRNTGPKAQETPWVAVRAFLKDGRCDHKSQKPEVVAERMAKKYNGQIKEIAQKAKDSGITVGALTSNEGFKRGMALLKIAIAEGNHGKAKAAVAKVGQAVDGLIKPLLQASALQAQANTVDSVLDEVFTDLEDEAPADEAEAEAEAAPLEMVADDGDDDEAPEAPEEGTKESRVAATA